LAADIRKPRQKLDGLVRALEEVESSPAAVVKRIGEIEAEIAAKQGELEPLQASVPTAKSVAELKQYLQGG